MSTDYHVRCKTCGVDHGFNDANHANDLMRALIVHRDAIAALVPLKRDASEVELRVYYGPIDPFWFAEHAGHDLAVFDEYGGEDGTCREGYPCACCQSRFYCDLPIGHDGPHGKVAR